MNLLRGHGGKFVKGTTGNPRGRPKGSLNRNAALLHEVQKFIIEDKSGRKLTFERALLEVALKKAGDGDAELAIEILKRLYVVVAPEVVPNASGVAINLLQNNAGVKSGEGRVRLSEFLTDAGTRDAVAGLVKRIASSNPVAGGNGDLHQ